MTTEEQTQLVAYRPKPFLLRDSPTGRNRLDSRGNGMELNSHFLHFIALCKSGSCLAYPNFPEADQKSFPVLFQETQNLLDSFNNGKL